MELKIYSPSADGFIKEIAWNHEEIKKEVAEKVKHYTSLVYTDDQIKEAKTDRATLNKFVAALENKRKEIKKQCLAPYEDFEKQMKEIVAIVNEPIQLIDSQVKTFEEQKKAEKQNEILQLWDGIEDKPEWLNISAIWSDKWLNASVKMSAIETEINSKLEQIAKDLITLANLPEFGFEATEEYKRSLDVNKAISEGMRLAEMQRRKAEQEKLKAEQEKLKAEQESAIKPTPNTSVPADAVEPQKQWISFHALLTVEDAQALKEFFTSRNIEFKKI